MRKWKLGIGLLIGLATFFGGNGWAGVIVDTGAGWSYCDGLALSNTQHLAGQFNTTNDYIITSFAGWLANAGRYYNNGPDFKGAGGKIDLFIYGDSVNENLGIHLPDPDATFLSIGAIDVPADSSPNWFVLTGITQDLAAGTYWLVFAPPDNGGFVGKMPSWPYTSPSGPYPQNQGPNPLTGFAYSSNGYTWTAFSPGESNEVIGDNYGIGVRIEDSSAVPLPSTVLLLGSGLAGLAFYRKRRSVLKG